ncbi:129_t:CDS:2 [Diversispora eburnea]|uniref:129_t:CDS:1 n=1 Tax=Diversispora eburnea TaxID=1213867 RepID=A0A9N8YXP4_9GLOM|nr:129_t:CDS:2 [Diversispora eburnea]
MDLFDGDLHNFLIKTFWALSWKIKMELIISITDGLGSLHAKDLVHCNFHSGNILINDNFNLHNSDLRIDLDSYYYHINVLQQFKIADKNQKNTSKSQKQELFELFSHSNPNLLLKSNESITSYVDTYNIDSTEEKEIQKYEFNESTTSNCQ